MKKSVTIICLLGLLFFTACSKDDDSPNSIPVDEEEILKSSEKQITSFVFETGNNTVLTEDLTVTIAESNKTISTAVAYGMDITALTPTIQISDRASINPSGAQDFSSPVTYSVTAEDGTKTEYTATIAIAENTGKKMLSFLFKAEDNESLSEDLVAEIDEDEQTITTMAPAGTDLTNLLPTLAVSQGATAAPMEAQDFSTPISYTVTAEDGSSADYEVNISLALSQKEILTILFNANPNNTLDWILNNPNISEWRGVVTDVNGNILLLALEDQGLDVIPPELGQLNSLIGLYLAKNNLVEIPKELGRLTNLTSLSLTSNKLVKVPLELKELTNLTDLSLRDNSLAEIPNELGELINLERLYLSDNSFTEIPAELGQLNSLITLDLSQNELTAIPVEIGQLTNLIFLSLAHNFLSEIPLQIGELTNLERLYLSYNSLIEIPIQIGQLTNLVTLYLDHNTLTKIPVQISQLVNLDKLFLNNNSLTSVPQEICNLNIQEFLLDDGVICE